jgi:hypothetical protein
MAGFSVPTGAIIIEFGLLFYILTTCLCISMIAPIANSQNAPFIDYLNIKYGAEKVYNFQYDGNITDFTDIGTWASNWNMSAANGLYATDINAVRPDTTILNGNIGATIKFGNIVYHENNNTESGDLVVNHLQNGETDILFMHDTTWILKNTYYYLTFHDGKASITTYDLSTFVGYMSNTFPLNNNVVPDSCTIHYEYNFNTGIFTLWINGNIWGYAQLEDIKSCNWYPKSAKKQIVTTDSIAVDGSGLNILGDNQYHPVRNLDHPSRSNFFGISIPLGMGNDYDDTATIFLEVLVWNIEGVDSWFNLLFIKFPLAIMFIIFVAIALSVLVSWIP